jgi:hypothetical protein
MKYSEMSNMNSLFFKGKMTALQPLTVTHKGAQTTKAHRLPRNGKSHTAKPYFPASNIRGAIRHSIHRELIRVAEYDKQPLLLDEQYMLAQGVSIGEDLSGNTEGVINLHKELREINPAIALLGAWKLQSQITVGPAYPQIDDCVAMFAEGARVDMFKRSPELMGSLPENQIDRLQNVLKNQALASVDKNDLKKQLKELAVRIKAELEPAAKSALLQNKTHLEAAIKAYTTGTEGEGSAGIQRPLDGYEAFCGGVEFDHRMGLINPTETMVGIALAGLRQFVRHPYLGSHTAHNCGLVAFEWEVSTYKDLDDLSSTKIGVIKVSLDSGLEIESEGGILQKCLADWDVLKKNALDSGIDIRKFN